MKRRAPGILRGAALEPTYEGLKQALVSKLPPGTPPLEPTYEGLKLEVGHIQPVCATALEPTYEGLKRG